MPDLIFKNKVSFRGWFVYFDGTLPSQDFLDMVLACASNSDCSFTRVASSQNARVYQASMQVQDIVKEVFVKHYLFRSRFDQLKHFLRSSRGKRALEATLMLRHNGFYAPKPVLLMEKRSGPFKTSSVFICEKVAGATSLKHLLQSLSQNNSARALGSKRSLIRDFGRTVGRMHARGIVHGDTRLSNVMVKEKAGKFLFWFIDNENTRQLPVLTARTVCKNLDQINIRAKVSNADRMRFFSEYCRERGLNPAESRKMAGMVMDRTAKRQDERAVRKPWKKAISG
ncbi:Mn2+dependent serine/threonine protein kinase [Desulfonatronospira thiodismutans ASO3-1]|uniref:non-specific serine/threonine protein kinase n=2 Tax=Desulfonatronospira thiodismutans TaxID=488939 RepID=D6STK9_9BACT|nr:Mn2+dependent serine/threonine protein kinase [Desulfonatronospira thiodismutans ASO3-1]